MNTIAKNKGLSIQIPCYLTTEDLCQCEYEILALNRLDPLDPYYLDPNMFLDNDNLIHSSMCQNDNQWINLSPPPHFEHFSPPTF